MARYVYGKYVLLNNLFHGPDTAWADARTDAAADADVIIRDVVKATIFFFNTANGCLRTCFEAHGAISAGSTGDAASGFLAAVSHLQATAVAWSK